MPSVPALHVSTISKVKGSAKIFIQSRKDVAHSGVFSIELAVSFDPAVDDYPGGTLVIKADLSDSAVATFSATSVELINAFGKHNPTVVLPGSCKLEMNAGTVPKGCRYCVIIASNKLASATGTPDVVGFVINDRSGNRVAYGTGPVQSGDVEVAPS